MARKSLIAILVLSVVLAAGSVAAAESGFVDVPEGHWAYEAIANLAAAGLVEGYPDGTFGGSRTLTRYEAAMVFSRMLTRLENVVRQDVAGEVQGLSSQVAGDVSQRVMAKATAEIQQSIVAAREALAQELERMVGEKLLQAPEKVVERVVVEKQPQVTERVVVEQPIERPFQMTDEARAAIAAVVADQVQRALAPDKIAALADAVVKSEDFTRAIDEAIAAKVGPILGLEGLDVDVAALRGDVDAVREVLNTRVEELSAAIDGLRQRVGTLEDQGQAAQQAASGLDQRVGALEERDRVSQSWEQGLSEEVRGNYALLLSTTQRVEGLEQGAQATQQSLDYALKSLDWVRARVAQLDQNKADASALDSARKATDGAIGDLTGRVATLEGNAASKLDVTALSARVDGLSSEKAAQGEVNDLKKDVESLRRTNGYLTWGLVIAGIVAVAGIFVK